MRRHPALIGHLFWLRLCCAFTSTIRPEIMFSLTRDLLGPPTFSLTLLRLLISALMIVGTARGALWACIQCSNVVPLYREFILREPPSTWKTITNDGTARERYVMFEFKHKEKPTFLPINQPIAHCELTVWHCLLWNDFAPSLTFTTLSWGLS